MKAADIARGDAPKPPAMPPAMPPTASPAAPPPLPAAMSGWVSLSPPRKPLCSPRAAGRYDGNASSFDSPPREARARDIGGGSGSSSSNAMPANVAVARPAAAAAQAAQLGAYVLARRGLSSQLSAMDADMSGLESEAHRALRSAVDQYHHLIVRERSSRCPLPAVVAPALARPEKRAHEYC